MKTTLYLATDNGLAILTADGERYRCELQSKIQNARCVAVDPAQPLRIYCGSFGSGVWRSEDGGRRWQCVGRGITYAQVLSIAVSERRVVYAGTEPSALFRSEDGGDSWRECGGLTDLPSAGEWSFPPRPETHHVRWIHPDSHAPGRLFVAIEAGALVCTPDGGNTWTDRVPTGPIDTHELATHASAPGRLYSAAGDGYFESLDGGNTWMRLEEGLSHRYVWSVAVDPRDADTRVIACAASARYSHNREEAESFFYRRTTDSIWRKIHDVLPDSAGRRTAVLAVHSGEPGTFFAIWESDLFRSTDGGASWHAVDVAWPEGFQVNEPRALAVADTG